MKRRSIVYSTSKLSALSGLAAKLKKEGIDARVNKAHNCVDIFENGSLVPSEQQYVRQDGVIDSYRCRYEYVGQGKGDYIQKTYPISEKNYTFDNPYIKKVSGDNIQMFIEAILQAYESGSMKTVSTIEGRLNSQNYDEVVETLNSCTPKDIIDLYHDVCDPITSATNIYADNSTDFTEEEQQLIEGQCDEAWDNYGDEYSIEDLAQVVWEHVEWLQNDLEDVSGNITKQSVIQYAEQYISDNF